MEFKIHVEGTPVQPSQTGEPISYPELENLRLADDDVPKEVAQTTDTEHDADDVSKALDDADDRAMESFEEYLPKIMQLLASIGLPGRLIEGIQHGHDFTNCVYGLIAPTSLTEHHILRVAVKESRGRAPDERSKTMESDIALQGFLKDQLPVPQIKAYSITTDNVLNAAYTVQTMIPGDSLNFVWGELDYAEKCDIVDQFIDLLAKIESIRFPAAGIFGVGAPLPAKTDDFATTTDVVVTRFAAVKRETLKDPKVFEDRTGTDIKKLLKSLLDEWIEDYQLEEAPAASRVVRKFKRLLAMLRKMDKEGSFRDPSPIVLHHWDLEPRNLMVSRASGAWKICGIIDWDEARSLPLLLGRKPPRWIWQFSADEKSPSGSKEELDSDHMADPELSEEQLALKAYFDEKVETVLPGYCEDAYGKGRWLRRIFFWALVGADNDADWEFIDQLAKDWAARSKPVVPNVVKPGESS